MTFNFDPPLSEWSDVDAEQFVELMLTGKISIGKSGAKKEKSTLAQSKIRKLGEKCATPIDRVALLVARKLTCRVCGDVDFSTQCERGKHETQCRKLKKSLLRAEAKARCDARIWSKYESQGNSNE